MRYNARELAGMSTDALWTLENQKVKVEFDDGVVEAGGKEVILSAYMWFFYALYPECKTRKCHILGNRVYSSKTHIDMINEVMWDCYDDYRAKGTRLDIETMCRQVYEGVNRYYNDMVIRTQAYVRSVHMTHYLDVMDHPTIRAANESIKPTVRSVDRTKKIIRDTLLDPDAFPSNPIAANARTGLVRIDPILDCVGPRGSLTDIDSRVFAKPVTSGFMEGIRDIQDSLMESRSGSKALEFAEDPLRTIEYFNRKLQLFADVVERLYPGDCGTPRLVRWTVEHNDLKALDGLYYQKGDQLVRFKRTDKDLIGETLRFRMALYCRHVDNQGVCETCYGALSHSVPNDSNLGQFAATTLCEQSAQATLSTKHQDTISNIDTLQISEEDQNFIQLGSNETHICLANRLKGKQVYLSIPVKSAERLNDIKYVEDTSTLNILAISELSTVDFSVIQNEREITSTIPVSIGTRMSSMSAELLAYIKNPDYLLTTNSGHYCIDLSHWDVEDPLFILPVRHINMLDHINAIEAFLKSSNNPTKATVILGDNTLGKYTNPDEALLAFHRLVNNRLSVNIANLAVLLRAAMCQDADTLSNQIPHLSQGIPDEFHFGKLLQLVGTRSVAPLLAYEGHRAAFFDPDTYLAEERMDHPLDAILQETQYTY